MKRGVKRGVGAQQMLPFETTYHTPFSSPWKPFPSPFVWVLVPKGVDEHADACDDIAQEYYGSKIAENILGGPTKSWTNLALAVIALLSLRDGQRLATWTFDGGLDDILFFLSVEDTVPSGTEKEGKK